MKRSKNGIVLWILSALTLAISVIDALRGAPTKGPSDPIDPTTRYERSDLHARAVFLTGLGVLVGTGLIVLLVYPLFAYLKQKRAEVSQSAIMAARGGNPVPPEPRIQASPTTDLHDFRVWEESQLHGYHWVDRQKQTVSIPIDEAIRIVARRGIPPQPDSGGTTYFDPRAGSRATGFEGKVEPEPR